MKKMVLLLFLSSCSLWKAVEPEVEDWIEDEAEEEFGVKIDIDLPPTPKIVNH